MAGACCAAESSFWSNNLMASVSAAGVTATAVQDQVSYISRSEVAQPVRENDITGAQAVVTTDAGIRPKNKQRIVSELENPFGD